MSHIVLATTQEVGIVGWCNNIKGREIQHNSSAILTLKIGEELRER